ncbi:PQQ-like beta-propeller repeat protein [Sphaerisporangium corydalis]|uniref:PQQ-like beta-propeller repeat protein n=1 Tax=Sphaerisporangium corydalis TaxID=1441875 RepID=A0ABV9EQC8_9ACTN|nr:PQQ-like beta-propeller repeat protein [Sphaerisporangium corydalis]
MKGRRIALGALACVLAVSATSSGGLGAAPGSRGPVPREPVRAGPVQRGPVPGRLVEVWHGRWGGFAFAYDPGTSLVLTAESSGTVVARDAGTGQVRWRRRTGADPSILLTPGVAVTEYALGSPEAVARHGLAALDLVTGRPLWRMSYTRPFDLATHAVAAGGLVLVGTTAAELTAVDARTGRTAWRRPLPPGCAYWGYGIAADRTTAAALLLCDRFRFRLVVMDPATGRPLWQRNLESLLRSGPDLRSDLSIEKSYEPAVLVESGVIAAHGVSALGVFERGGERLLDQDAAGLVCYSRCRFAVNEDSVVIGYDDLRHMPVMRAVSRHGGAGWYDGRPEEQPGALVAYGGTVYTLTSFTAFPSPVRLWGFDPSTGRPLGFFATSMPSAELLAVTRDRVIIGTFTRVTAYRTVPVSGPPTRRTRPTARNLAPRSTARNLAPRSVVRNLRARP